MWNTTSNICSNGLINMEKNRQKFQTLRGINLVIEM